MKYIPLTNSDKMAIVDDEYFDLVMQHNWYLNGSGYANTSINGNDVSLHRFIINAIKGQEVDHKEQDRLDCRIDNLRFCTHGQNIANDGSRKNNKLGVKGVDQIKKTGKYRATIRVNYKKIHLGNFDTLFEAAKAYNEASRKYFGEFGYQNDLESIHA